MTFQLRTIDEHRLLKVMRNEMELGNTTHPKYIGVTL